MRIDLNTTVPRTSDAADAGKSRVRTENICQESGDLAELSNDDQVQTLTALLNEVPEIRQEKVAALSELVQSGRYSVSSQQTAQALMAYSQEDTAA